MKFKKYIFTALMLTLLAFGAYSTNFTQAAQTTAAKTRQVIQVVPVEQAGKAIQPVQSEAVHVTPLDVVENPSKYLNKKIVFTGTFDKFATLGLDYSKAMRSSQNYIAFLIQRPDTKDHDIPLSEMKLFLKREYAEKFIELETGDKIEITGNVFATALNDPWVDVEKIVIKEKLKKPEKQLEDISKK